MSIHRFALILACLSAAGTSALAGQEAKCPAVTYSDLVGNPITGEVRGTEITITEGQKGCLVLVKVAEGRFKPTKVGTPILAGDSLSIRLSDGASFTGVIAGDTLRGRFDYPDAKPLVLHRHGAVHVHEH